MTARIAIVLVAACAPELDVAEPITLEPRGAWTGEQLADLVDAAECWNLGFGTRFEVAASSTGQQVTVEFAALECLGDDAGRYSEGFAGQISLCPSLLARTRFGRLRLMWVIAHELGHAAGIHAHGSDPDSIMGETRPWVGFFGADVAPMFSDEDIRLFAEAHPGFVPPTPTCDPTVHDDSEPVADGWQRQHCSCGVTGPRSPAARAAPGS